MTYRILVTGSREWTDEQMIREALLRQAASDRVTLIHGGARGADRIAAQVARENGWEIREHQANWVLHGRRAGFLRNQRMVQEGADLCLAFILNRSRGATMCADLAEAAGIPTWRYIVET